MFTNHSPSLFSSYIPSHATTKANQSNEHCSSENLSQLQKSIIGIHNSSTTFSLSVHHSEIETMEQPGIRKVAPTASKHSAIDQFIAKLDTVKIESQPKIGSGSYGSCYHYGDFVIKVPVNDSGNFVDWYSQEHKNASPERVSRYLNEANNDPDYSRSTRAVFKNKSMNVLVSKFVQGHELDVDDDQNYFRASDHLESRGLYMHDINVIGNILVDKDDNLHIIDGDQLVYSQSKRLERQPSLATIDLEEQIESSLQVKLKMAINKKNDDDAIYYQALINEIKDLRVK
ncbi:TPA: hypothetical protein ACXHW4_004795 [Enterobacter hormaechei]